MDPFSLPKQLVTVSSGSDDSNSDSESSSNSSEGRGEASELMARCVELPSFLLSHAEYSEITVP